MKPSESCQYDHNFTRTRHQAVIIILLCATFLFFKYLMQVSPSVMTQQLMATFHLRATGLGVIGSSFFVSYLIAQISCGFLLDRFSVRWLCTCAILVSVSGLLVFAGTDLAFWAITGRVLMGAGAAFATVSYMKLTANWFRPNQFAQISGFVATAAMVGALCGDGPLKMVQQALGWQTAILVCAGFGVVLAILFATLVRDHPPPPYSRTANRKQAIYSSF